MAILLKSGGLFLHVPKTGGQWVSEVLEANDLVFAHVGGQHAGAAQLTPLERLLQTPHRYNKTNRPLFKFCFVRHPLHWYESWYRQNVARGWPEYASDEESWSPTLELNGTGAATFNGFVENVLRQRPGFLSGMYDLYARDAHFVGRHEHLVEDLSVVLTFLRATVNDERLRAHQPVNASEAVDVRLDRTLHQALEDAERDAFVRYGYAGEGTASAARPAFTPFAPSVLLPGPFAADAGCAWRIAAPELARFADTDEYPYRSMLSLLENGMPLRQAHAAQADVRRMGEGRFSHWDDAIVFSTSDNTDPNENGRRYDLAWAFPAPFDSTHLMMPQTVCASATAATKDRG
jgi:hypothetical protein